MAEGSSSPLLGTTATSSRRSPSQRSRDSDEQTPLLSNTRTTPENDHSDNDDDGRDSSPAATSLRSIQEGRFSPPPKRRLISPTSIAIALLGILATAIMIFAFVAPAVVESYAKQALVIEPTGLLLDSFTSTGVKARIQADFRLDASRVQQPFVRNLGRFGTWIAKEVESKESNVEVYLPEYDNILIGTAAVPPVVVNIRNGHTTHIDFLAALEPGNIAGIRNVVNDWLDGRLGQLKLHGKANVALKSGIIPLGSQTISEAITLEGRNIPTMPKYKITRLNVHDIDIPGSKSAMAANASLSVANPYPVSLQIPPMAFDILVPNCAEDQPYIPLADAMTGTIAVQPKTDVEVDVGGVVKEIPDTLTTACPGSDASPLDILLGKYIHGNDTTVFVRGSSTPNSDTPRWISDFLTSVTVPVPFPGRSLDNMVRNFTLKNVAFGLPDPWAPPGSPESNPMISGTFQVIAGLPKEMNFGVNVSRVRATADVYFKKKKLGCLNLRQWQQATSTRMADSSIMVESNIKDAPLYITDDAVFQDVVGDLLFGGKAVMLKIDALVDLAVETVLGELIVRDVPGKGDVPVKPIPHGGLSNIQPRVDDLRIKETSTTSITFQARVNFTNPTEYTARVPYINIHISKNGSLVGHATVRNASFTKGNNSNILVDITWDPLTLGGKKARTIGRDLLSQYISGFNTTMTVMTHSGSIPSLPQLGEALSNFKIDMPAPRLSMPRDEDDDDDDDDNSGDDGPHLIKDATFHIFSSTASFTLASPLGHTDIYIEHINATAFYNHTEPIGTIVNDLPLKVPPGISVTPKLPVDWSLDSVGYEKLRKALGGELKLDAVATAGVRMGNFREELWYIGRGIGAKVTV